MSARLLDWVEIRFPLQKMWREHMVEYYAPKNLNFWYYFGSLALLVLVIQIVSGTVLAMHYKPDAELAFASVEYIMRDVPMGWIMRYAHSTGASFFMIIIYLHMFRAMLYGSYRAPREILWLFGMLIYFALMAETFMGYLLPWGNMSYWGAQVIINLASAIPWVGDDIATWVRGGYAIADPTLNRFFAFHIASVPLIIIALVVLHIVALHTVGSNNPDGIEIKEKKDINGIPKDGISFHPYYSVKDFVGVVIFLMLFTAIIFFYPEFGGIFLEQNNFAEANILQTPDHIAPIWYFTPFYSILRAFTYPFLGIDAKAWGVVAMIAANAIFCFLPWLDRSPVKSIRYKGALSKIALRIFVVVFIVLGYEGFQKPEGLHLIIAQIATFLYFAFFFLMPWYTKYEKCKPEPDQVTG